MSSVTRIEIVANVFDTRAAVRKKKLQNIGLGKHIKDLSLIDVYTIEKDFTKNELEKIASALTNPITQEYFIHTQNKKNNKVKKFDLAIEVGFLPGVTDNVAATTKEIIEDLLKIEFQNGEGVYSSQITRIVGQLSEKEVQKIADSLYNPLIQRINSKSFKEYQKDGGREIYVPKVHLTHNPHATYVNLEVSDEELVTIGKSGIANSDGSRRGPLAMDIAYMKTIRDYFRKLGRKPTDVEIESLAQTWSEHCKHTIFANPLDEVKDGLFKTYIKGATDKIRKKKGNKDFCVSVFKDNSGGIKFDNNFLLTHKVETHNSPSALDPFGGSITGIVGVNRDTIGFGLGAKPIANFYGFCFANPKKDIPLYKGPEFTQKMLSSRRIMDGVIDGVNAGGNQSGIPTPLGFVYFNERYRGKPLVFVGTVGLIPIKINGEKAYKKKAQAGDLVVMIGGRVGKDGIHGATFSSEAMDSGSPATAVQIGDPITQKKLSDAIVKEARDLLLYNSITDNGAGGLSCSVAEMAKESNGCLVNLEKVPVKYPGLNPWEIWISESQERMTLAVPPRKWERLEKLLKKRGVEATVIGKFTDSGRCVVKYKQEKVMDINLNFLHYGLPQKHLKSSWKAPKYTPTNITSPKDLTSDFVEMIGRLNIAGYSFISTQYDHTVQGSTILGPLVGKGLINSETAVMKPVLSSDKGYALSCALYPTYSEIDSYLMAACTIDNAIRNVIAVGGKLDSIALLDNFCWCESDKPERLGQLKKAAQSCYDYAVAFGTPFISGKDSMFNDFKGFDKDGTPLKISIPPTLLISSLGIIENVGKIVSLDVKMPGDILYLLGETFDELTASEYYDMLSEKMKKPIFGYTIPQVDAVKNKKLYESFSRCVNKGLIASSISLGRGGLGVALAKIAMAGMLGLEISFNASLLFSESQGRLLVTVAPKNCQQFEKLMTGNFFTKIGQAIVKPDITIKGLTGITIVNTDVSILLKKYRSTFEGF